MRLWPFYARRTIRHARRYRHIVTVLMKYGFAEAVARLPARLTFRSRARTGGGASDVVRRQTTPERVRLALQDLGPTFIKLGQLLSTRPDLLPPEYIQELCRLQDRVDPEPFDQIRALVESELGAPMETLFQEFQEVPIAAGSIAQVHRAVMPDGQVVAVKVCRPGVRQKLATECEMIQDLADWIGTVRHTSGTIDLPRMVREFTRAAPRETNMALERRNIERFARNFADDPTVHIPDVVANRCTDTILTMEFIEGVKPTGPEALDTAGFDRRDIAIRGANFVLAQIFKHGLFHSDPHPGNLLLMGENVVVPLDFGQVARLRTTDRELLTDLILAIVDSDHEQIVHACQSAGVLSDATDLDEFASDAEELADRYYDVPLKDIPLREVIASVFQLVRRHQLCPPPQFTLMLKSLMTIESLARMLDPEFDIITALRPYAAQFRMEQLDPRRALRRARRAARDAFQLAAHLPQDLRAILTKIKKGNFQLHVHHEHLVELTSTLNKSSNRISFSLIIAALLVASSLLTPQEGMFLNVVPLQVLGVIGYCVAAVLGLWLLISILRSRSM